MKGESKVMIRPMFISQFEVEHAGRKIVYLPSKEEPQEVIAEIYRATDESVSIADVLVMRSSRHLHNSTGEDYMVTKGLVDVHVCDYGTRARPALGPESPAYHIFTGCDHWVESLGAPARMIVVSRPAWSPKDHHPFVDPDVSLLPEGRETELAQDVTE